jgi:hypothetical protein
MKKIILVVFSFLFIHIAKAQESTLTINNQTITDNVIGKWRLMSSNPSDAVNLVKGFIVKGPGYGEITKGNSAEDSKPVVSKIFAQGNNSICFSDAEGNRTTLKVSVLRKDQLTVTDGKASFIYVKEGK